MRARALTSFLVSLVAWLVTASAGLACRHDADCSAGWNCDFDASLGSASLCVQAPLSGPCALGHLSPCGMSSNGDQYWCDASDQCKPPSAEGGTCDPIAPDSCGPEHWCSPWDGRCHRRGSSPGDACDPLNDDSCAMDLWCRPGTRTCVARGDVGATCDASADRTCAGTLWCRDGTCSRASARGGPCDPAQPDSCEYALACIGARCEPPPECEPGPDACPAGLYCVNVACIGDAACRGICKGPSGWGGDCDPREPGSCMPGLTCTSEWSCERVVANRDSSGRRHALPGLVNVLAARTFVARTEAGDGGTPGGTSQPGGATSGGGGGRSHGGRTSWGKLNGGCASFWDCDPGLFCADSFCHSRGDSIEDRRESYCPPDHPLRGECLDHEDGCRCQAMLPEGKPCLPGTCIDDAWSSDEAGVADVHLLCVDGTCRTRSGILSSQRGSHAPRIDARTGALVADGAVECEMPSGSRGEVYFCDASRAAFTLDDPHAPWTCAAWTADMDERGKASIAEFAEGSAAGCGNASIVQHEPPASITLPHLHGAGQPCGGVVRCVSGTFCNESGTCETPRGAGASCRWLGALCADGLTCDLVSGTCASASLPTITRPPSTCSAGFTDLNPFEDGIQYSCCEWSWGRCTKVAYWCDGCDRAGGCIEIEKGQADIDAACGVGQ